MNSPKPVKPSTEWTVDHECLSPSQNELIALQTWLSEREGDDLLVKFVFPQSGGSTISILSSRLEFAGGPFAALLNVPFKEKQSREVTLSCDDNPETFQLIRSFLYKRKIAMTDGNDSRSVDLQSIIRVILSAHRWQLDQLVTSLLTFIEISNMICDINDLLQLIPVFQWPVCFSKHASNFFWFNVSEFYDKICEQPHKSTSLLVANKEKNVETTANKAPHAAFDPPCPLFPNLWPLLLSEPFSTLYKFVQNIIVSDSLNNNDAQRLLLGYLEPRIEDDDQLIELFSLLKFYDEHFRNILEDKELYKNYSSRAIYFLSKVYHARNRNELTLRWDISLFKLEKAEGFNTTFLCPTSTLRPKLIPFPNIHSIEEIDAEQLTAIQVVHGLLMTLTITKQSQTQAHLSWKMTNFRKDFNNLCLILLEIYEDNSCRCVKDGNQRLRSRAVSSPSTSVVLGKGEIYLGIDDSFLADCRERHKKTCSLTLTVTIYTPGRSNAILRYQSDENDDSE